MVGRSFRLHTFAWSKVLTEIITTMAAMPSSSVILTFCRNAVLGSGTYTWGALVDRDFANFLICQYLSVFLSDVNGNRSWQK